jgi:hypothetical protein
MASLSLPQILTTIFSKTANELRIRSQLLACIGSHGTHTTSLHAQDCAYVLPDTKVAVPNFSRSNSTSLSPRERISKRGSHAPK